MKTASTLFFILALITTVCGQIEFVGEVNPGTGDVGEVIAGVALDENTFIFAAGPSSRQKPYVIDENGLTFLGDLVMGEDSSSPGYFTNYKGLVYFLANSDDGRRIWQTDGTPDGTIPAFGLGDANSTLYTFSEPLIGRDGLMYFGFEDAMYSYDGESLTKIEYEYPISVPFIGNFKAYSSCLYNDGIAIINYQQDGAVLLSVQNNTVEALAELPHSGSTFDDHYGLQAFEGGLIFTVESFSDDTEGNYTFDAASGTIVKIGDGSGALRTDYINDKSCIATNFKGATYAFSADNNEGVEIFDRSPSISTSEDWEVDRVLNGVLFVGEEDSFEDTEIVFYNPTTETATNVHTTDDASAIFTEGFYSFYFAESELGEKFGDSDLFAYDHNTETVSPIWTLVGDSRSERVTPVTVINDDIYFFADVDDNIGRELYRYPLSFTTSTKETFDNEHLVLNKKGDNIYSVSSTNSGQMRVDVYTISGQKFKSSQINPEDLIEINAKGALVVSITQGRSQKTIKIIR